MSDEFPKKIRRAKHAIRRDWMNHPHAKGLLLNADICPGASRLKAKLLVFNNRRNLRNFWRKGLGRSDIGKCRGAVTELRWTVHNFKGKAETRYTEVDPRYFCVIGLVKGFLTMNIICHEAVHAGMAFSRRIKKTDWSNEVDRMPEEAICYPAGIIAQEINHVLFKNNLYKK